MSVLSSLQGMASNARSGVGTEIKSSRLVRLGLIAAGVILWANVTILLFDKTGDLEARISSLAEERRRYEAVARDPQWPQRQAASEALADRALQRLWPAESEAIARADFQEWVLRMARESGLGRPTVRVERSVVTKGPPGSEPIAAQLSADFTPEALIEFLKRISTGPRVTIVTTLRVQKSPVPRVDTVITAFTRSPGATS
jgi:hypothetical protein